jgi:hypothetical protein
LYSICFGEAAGRGSAASIKAERAWGMMAVQVVKSSLLWKAESMADLGAVLEQLKAERAKLDRAIEALSGVVGRSGKGRGGKRKLSAAARARIAEAQRKRWAKFKAKKGR